MNTSKDLIAFPCSSPRRDRWANAFACENTVFSAGHITKGLKEQLFYPNPESKNPQPLYIYSTSGSIEVLMVGLYGIDCAFSIDTFKVNSPKFAERVDIGEEVALWGLLAENSLVFETYVLRGKVVAKDTYDLELGQDSSGESKKLSADRVLIKYDRPPVRSISGSMVVNNNGEIIANHIGLTASGFFAGAAPIFEAKYRKQMEELRKYHTSKMHPQMSWSK